MHKQPVLLQINPVVRLCTSTGRIMKDLGEAAMAAGWKSYIAYGGARDGSPEHSSHLVPVGGTPDLVLHGAATRLLDAHGLASRKATRRLVDRIEEIDPDVIHIHNIHGYFLHYPTLMAYLRDSGKPVVWTAHDCWLYTGHCYHYAFAGCDRWRYGCGHCPQRGAFPRSLFLDRSARNWCEKRRAFGALENLTVVTPSLWMRREMASSFLADKHFEVIPNGIDLDVFRPEAGERESQGTVILAVASRWLAEKGFDDLVRLADGLNKDERLVVVGRLSAARRRRLPQRTEAVERTADIRALAALYAAATVLVNPTWQDNYPTVNIEAMACGTPVVTYRTGGSPESITEGTGAIVNQGDTAAMLAAVRRFAAEDREATARRCREHAVQHFGRQDCYRRYIELYDNLISKP